MLLTPRIYALAQTADDGRTRAEPSFFTCTVSQKELEAEERRARKMLLLHQTGAVKVGEVVRYTVTYTPSEDRILPPPAHLHVRIRNSSAIPLRAAYLHGPYTIHVSAYPSTFNPNRKADNSHRYGLPDFEPNLKAGGYWTTRLTVPEHMRRDDARNTDGTPLRATWILEIASQIIFSNSASVSYELLVARDERSLELGFTSVTANSQGVPGKVKDHQQDNKHHHAHHPHPTKGVYSKAIRLLVDDTTSLWNKPKLPECDAENRQEKPTSTDSQRSHGKQKQQNLHLVLVTHGLHSNLGADMLYLKESIDATARQAREDRRRRRQQQRAPEKHSNAKDVSTAPLSGGQEELEENDEEEGDDEEEVIVRGFDGNVIRTERGIQYLGKRLAKYVLHLTYPDQPFLPIKKSMGQKLSSTFAPTKDKVDEGIPVHHGSSVQQQPQSHQPRKRAYKFTSISFIGHSLGGLVQTYAIAYIHKHSPTFFEQIKPINFIALASPFLGLSNENPMYVKFALDFGLVGRTGQDLGLTWKAPTLAKSGWNAVVSGLSGQSPNRQNQHDPGAKPLLRILPTGPAHMVLRMFRNRTLYSNVVNDGIVPLRTSCLLFLDWRGLGRVEKARRENGLIGTVAVWGYGQITGHNASPSPSRIGFPDDSGSGTESPTFHGNGTAVPLPSADLTNQEDEAQTQTATEPSAHQFLDGRKKGPDGENENEEEEEEDEEDKYFQPQNTLMQLWSYIRPTGKHTSRDKKMFTRSQTVFQDHDTNPAHAEAETTTAQNSQSSKRPQATRGDSVATNSSKSTRAPPKTTIFESAGDLINPPVPPSSWINDPSSRSRTIFHDRIYHPEDIPPPPAKKKAAGRSVSGESMMSQSSTSSADEGVMRVEEKIARAYHKDLSWRKVLVRLEPDAHNNMIVRRMFANAYGWPVIKHLCDTHFADTYSAQTRDEDEPAIDRAAGVQVPVNEDGEHVAGQEDAQPPSDRSASEMREVADELAPLKTSGVRQPKRKDTGDSIRSIGSVDWDSVYFEGTSDDDDDDTDDRNAFQKFLQPTHPKAAKSPRLSSPTEVPLTPDEAKQGTSKTEISDFLRQAAPMEGHRGLGANPSSKLSQSPAASPTGNLAEVGLVSSSPTASACKE